MTTNEEGVAANDAPKEKVTNTILPTNKPVVKKSWRDVYRVHPAADLFPMLPEDELRKLGADIKANGLRDKVVLYTAGVNQEYVLLDGRNRLDAMELVGMPLVENQSTRNSPDRKPQDDQWGFISGLVQYEPLIDPYVWIISKNIHRRHLTKEQRADYLLKVMKMKETDLAKAARSVKRDSDGRVKGSTKDPFKEKFVEEAKKQGISKRTAEKSIAKTKGPTQKPRKTKAARPTTKATPAPKLDATTPVVRVPASTPAPIMTTIVEKPEVKPVEESLSFTDPAFKGDNTYNVTFAVDGTRVSTVKKRIVELFPDCKEDIEVENKYPKVSNAELLDEAKSTVEELRDRLQEWRDNLPENLQFGEKADQLDECIRSLDSIVSDMESVEFPSAFGS